MLEALANLHFIRPWWLVALVPALLLALVWARRRAGGSHWEASIEPQLLEVLLEPGARQRSRRLPWIVAGALSLAALGLSGPSWERLPQPVEQKRDALVILFDLSLSMFAQDVEPSRLVRARQKIADVLRRRDEGVTALVAYAGDAHAVVPLTDDTRTIENLLPALRPDMMPVLGSDLASALEQAHDLFDNAAVRQGRILVVTDAVDDMSAATESRSRRYPISILGIGTAEGANIPLDFVNQPGQVLRTQSGDAIVARLEESRLASIADTAYGRYHTLTLGDADLDHLLDTPLPGEEETAEVEREFDTWADMGFWVCVALVPLLLAGFRRGLVALVPLLLLPPPAQAGLWDDLWQRRDQQAYQAMQEGRPEAAAALFEQSDWRAAALYRSGEFAAAADAYARAESLTATYNLGNALARQGEYDAAIAAYDRVLAAHPEHEDASYNKALIEQLKDQQSAKQRNDERQQRGGDEPQQSTRPQDDSEPGEGEQQDQAGQPPPQDQPPPSSEGEQSRPEQQRQGDERSESTASRDEKRDALEQWLRRVPDDPGGLLRRKFQYETNQRLRRGDYRSQETEKIW